MPYTSQTPYVPHAIVKSHKVVQTAVGILEREAVLPALFNRGSIDVFKGALNDTVTVRFPGVLPWRQYDFRNDRTDPIVFDSLAESTTSITLGDHIYSATRVTDEQRDFDDLTVGSLIPIQAKAVLGGLNKMAADLLNGQTYPFVIGNSSVNLRQALLEARKIANAMNWPADGRVLLVGVDFEQKLLLNDKLVLAQNAGDRRADAALTDATLGTLFGWRIVATNDIPADTAIAAHGSAFTLYTAAPSIPQGVIAGATFGANGFALRWMHDYETTRMMERSVVDVWAGTGVTKDRLINYDKATGLYTVGTSDQFVRAFKLTLGGTSSAPAAGSDIAIFSGISTAPVIAA